MPKYRLRSDRRVPDEIRRLPSSVGQRVREAIRSLEDTPRPPGCRKLRGYRDLYRVRVGDYRVIYRLDNEKRLVTMELVIHRGGAYQ